MTEKCATAWRLREIIKLASSIQDRLQRPNQYFQMAEEFPEGIDYQNSTLTLEQLEVLSDFASDMTAYTKWLDEHMKILNWLAGGLYWEIWPVEDTDEGEGRICHCSNCTGDVPF